MKKSTLLALFFSAASLSSLYATDRHVYPGDNIQSSIDNSAAGDQIIIHAGTYAQAIEVSNKSNLTITAAGDGIVNITGDGNAVNTVYIFNPNNITFSNFNVTNIRKLAWSTGIAVEGSGSGISILNNNLTDFAYREGSWDATDNPGNNVVGVNPLMIAGTDTSSPITNVLISGNTVSYCMTGWNESITVKANVDGFVVENNTVHHVTNIAIDAYGLGSWPNSAQARNGKIINNTVYEAKCNITDNGGIYVDGGKDIIIANNRIYSSRYGITIGSENQGQVDGGVTSGIKVLNNVVYNNEKAGIMIGTSGDDDGLQGEVTNCYISGNTFLKNSTTDSWGSEIVIQNSSYIEVYNNIFHGLYQPMITQALGTANNTFGYNVFYNDLGLSPIVSKQTATGWSTLTFSQFKAENNDNSSLNVNPLLQNANATSPDVHLTETSPCINAGSPNYSAYAGEVDIDGEARVANGRIDVGADEAGSATPVLSIAIDGDASDWSSIESIATAGNQTAQTLKAFNDNSSLFLSVSGANLSSTNYHFFIDADKNTNTGYQSTDFSASGIEYMVENGSLYQYTGTGSDWSWAYISAITAFKSNAFVEIAIGLSTLNINNSISLAFTDISDSWAVVSQLGFADYSLNSSNTKIGVIANKEVSINAFPNPITDKLTINLGEKDTASSIYLYDLKGNLLFQTTTARPNIELDASTIPANSIVVLKVVSEGKTEVIKLKK